MQGTCTCTCNYRHKIRHQDKDLINTEERGQKIKVIVSAK